MSDLPFTLDQLRILKAIAAEGSFSVPLIVSTSHNQQSVSLQVQNLERQLDVPLFDGEDDGHNGSESPAQLRGNSHPLSGNLPRY